MITFVDSLLNKITMYRLILYYLFGLLVIGGILGAIGILPISPIDLILSTIILTLVSLATNEIFAKIFTVHTNAESAYITAWILALIIPPAGITDVSGISFLILASVIAMASKYILAINKKHLFNPVAIAVVITAFGFGKFASWWGGGSIFMIPFVIIGGLLITRKIQRFDLVLSFLVGTLVSLALGSMGARDPWDTILKGIQHAPIFCFAFIMLTEPLTTPPTHLRRIFYGAFVGLIFSPRTQIGSIHSTPELALVVGNIFSYIMSPKAKYIFALKEKREIGKNLYDFIFIKEKPFIFSPGQYMEWTLKTKKNDARGNRRYFTIASSPTEAELHLGVKFPEQGSSFKQSLLTIAPGETIMGGQLAGDFTLPQDPSIKLAFLAGGIGITPFRSMVKYLVDRDEKRDIVLFYSNRTTEEVGYQEVFEEAEQKIGLRPIYFITDTANTSLKMAVVRNQKIDADAIKRDIPDFIERTFYISGTHEMVTALRKALSTLEIPSKRIKTDFFPGF